MGIAIDDSFEDLLEQIERDPIAGAAAARERHKGVRRGRYESAVAGFAIAQAVRKKKKTGEFYKLEFFDGRQARDPKKLLLHAMQYNYDDLTGEESACAQDHATAFAPFLEKLKPAGMLKLIVQSGGFDGLKKAVKQKVTTKNRLAVQLCGMSLADIKKIGLKKTKRLAASLELAEEGLKKQVVSKPRDGTGQAQTSGKRASAVSSRTKPFIDAEQALWPNLRKLPIGGRLQVSSIERLTNDSGTLSKRFLVRTT